MRLRDNVTFSDVGRLRIQGALGSARQVPQREDIPVRKVGILLVHGIGNQKRGKTLTQNGEPLFSYLKEWLNNHSGDAELESVVLRIEPGRRTPAHAVIRLWQKLPVEEARPAAPLEVGPVQGANASVEASPTAPTDAGPAQGAIQRTEATPDAPAEAGTVQGAAPSDEASPAAPPEAGAVQGVVAREEATPVAPAEDGPAQGAKERDETTWLLAESTWADVFEQPSFGSVATWSLRVVPLFLLTQFVDQLSDDLTNTRITRAALSFSYLVLTFPLALLIQLLVLLLVPLSLLPPLRPVVGPIQRWISAVIGDTFVLLTSRFQFQSMVSTVRQDLDWLVRRCDVIAVLGHSQGAAVAHEAVRQAQEPKVERFITFGSAVARLKALRQVTEHARPMLTASSLVTFSASVLTGLYLWSLFGSGPSLLQLVFGFWGLGTALALANYLMPFSLKQINEKCHETQQFGLAEHTKWEDYYATADPVPNGQMLYARDYTQSSLEVYNGANLFTDHTTYWKNKDQFGSALLHSLMTLTGGAFEAYGVPVNAALQAGRERAIRTRYRVLARIVAVVVLSVAVFQHPKLWSGVSVPEALQLPFGWLAGFVNWILLLVGDALGLVGSKLKLTPADLPMPQIHRPVTVLSWPLACMCLVLLWFILSGTLLRWWEQGETARRFRSEWRGGINKAKLGLWVGFSLLGLAWFGFWVWWLVLSPSDLFAQLGAKLEPLKKSTGNGNVVWVIAVYFLIRNFVDAWKDQRDLRERLRKEDRFVEIGATTFGARNPDYRSNLPDLPGLNLFPPLPEPEKSNFKIFVEILRDTKKNLAKRFGGKRDFSPVLAAWFAVVLAVLSLGVIVFNFHIRGGVVQAAFGLVALALGVRAWVYGTGLRTRLAAAIGMTGGVVVMPWAAAATAGFGSVAGIGLLVAGLVSVVCAVGAAELLRQGWSTINNPPGVH